MFYRNIGLRWETSEGKDVAQNEVDIVAIYTSNKRVLIGEVKRLRRNLKPRLLQQKVEFLRTKLFYNYEVETKCFTVNGM